MQQIQQLDCCSRCQFSSTHFVIARRRQPRQLVANLLPTATECVNRLRLQEIRTKLKVNIVEWKDLNYKAPSKRKNDKHERQMHFGCRADINKILYNLIWQKQHRNQLRKLELEHNKVK